MSHKGLDLSLEKLRAIGADSSFCAVFERMYRILESGDASSIGEAEVLPLQNITRASELSGEVSAAVCQQTALIKLNGGLGTTMGLEKAKSLLKVKGELTFLDIIARSTQILRSDLGAKLPLIFMNSFNTSKDTTDFLERNYPALVAQSLPGEFIQHCEPKLTADLLEPLQFPQDEFLEWCPPGHGDFYSAIFGSGVLEKCLENGFKYAFVSNADNLGAVFSPQIATHFASTGAEIMLELADKTPKDIKGGHIVLKNGKMLLREVAQIPPEDLAKALDPQAHPYFNTNSLWFDLEQLFETLRQSNGVLDLPLIRNLKRARPGDDSTPQVIQMETAIGAGISALEKTAVLSVPRSRFLPVKTNEDLELLRSSAFGLTEKYSLERV